MTKLPFRSLLLPAAVVSALAITGCDVEDAAPAPSSPIQYGTDVGGPGCDILDTITGSCAEVDDAPSGYYAPGVHPRFNPVAGDLPLNTDILFAGTTDGTANFDNPDNPVELAINKLDGWSVSAAFNVLLSGAVDPDSISPYGGGTQLTNPMQNVFVLPIETVAGGDALDPRDIALPPATFNPANIAATAFSVAAVNIDGGTANALRITPTAPLLPKKKYLVVVTNGIQDATGDPLTSSVSYEILGTPGGRAACADNNVVEQLYDVCDAIDGWEQLAAGFLAQRNASINADPLFIASGLPALPTDPAALRASLALTYTFTTTDPTATMLAMAAPRAAVVQAAVGAGIPPGTAGAQAAMLQAGGLLPTPAADTGVAVSPLTAADLGTLSGGALDANVGDLYTGAISLPYYLATPADEDFFTSGWSADQALGAELSRALGGTLPPADTDGSFNVTYRYPFAAERSTVKVPLQVTLPDPAFVPDPDVFGGANCGQVQTAQSGYPVAIYVHGITSDRASVVALAHTLAKNCIATVAIDLPMHGLAGANPLNAALNAGSGTFQTLYPGVAERHFNRKAGAAGAPTPFTGDASDSSGSLFINLAYAVNSRDNIRQAVMDLLNLNASLGNIGALDLDGIGGADFNLNKVYVVGVSLGGKVANMFAAINQQAIAAEGLAGFSSNLNPVQGAVLSVAGGQLTKLLENSGYFSPILLGGLSANGVDIGTENFERFMYVFQSILDPADPVAYAKPLADTGMPLLLQEIIGGGNAGDGKTYTADKVVPNNALTPINAGGFTAPLAGTDPFAELMGAVEATFGPNNAASAPLITRMTVGHHASLLRPQESSGASPTAGELIATTEMHIQVVSFILSGGTNVAVGTAGTDQGFPVDFISCGFVAGCTVPPI